MFNEVGEWRILIGEKPSGDFFPGIKSRVNYQN
jgi:hypothetical protein